MGADHPNKFRNPYAMDNNMAIRGYIRELEKELQDITIPMDIIVILTVYFDYETDAMYFNDAAENFDLYKFGIISFLVTQKLTISKFSVSFAIFDTTEPAADINT